MKIKTLCISTLAVLVLTASQCKKEGKDCHYEITIRNTSNHGILAGYRFTNPDNKCILDGLLIPSNKDYKQSERICWERVVSNSKPYDLYIIDPSNYNLPNVFYSCDSIGHKNTILKHYTLTLEDLKSMDFTITYP